MHCWKTQAGGNPDAAACYVSNYGPWFHGSVRRRAPLSASLWRRPELIAATVAMEYVPGAPDPVRFFVFDDNGYRSTLRQLDSEGPKPVPGVCLACHGGNMTPRTTSWARLDT